MISQKAKLHNRFDFEIFDVETGETEYAQAENIVLNNMWSRLCGGSTYFANIGVGTGSGTLSPTRTGLFAHLAYKTATGVEQVYDTATTAHITKKVTFSEPEANGVWTEVGIMFDASTANYVTHALITDAEGNPITVNKTNTKIITVYATVFVEMVPLSTGNGRPPIDKDSLATLLLNGGSNVAAFALSALKRLDGGGSNIGLIGYSGNVSWSADVANKRRYTGLVRFSTTQGNHDVRSVLLQGNSGSVKPGWGSAGIPVPSVFESFGFAGIAVGTGDGVTTEFDLPKDLIIPLSETIKVNGVAKTRGTDYEVHYGVRSTTTLLVNTPEGQKEHFNNPLEWETCVIPQPPDAFLATSGVVINSIIVKGTLYSNTQTYAFEISLDGTTWIPIGSGTMGQNTVVTMNSFTPDKYKYLRWKGTLSETSYFKIGCVPPTQKQIKFTSPPASGAVITADFAVDYIPKSANFVLDVQAEVLFGEGV